MGLEEEVAVFLQLGLHSRTFEGLSMEASFRDISWVFWPQSAEVKVDISRVPLCKTPGSIWASSL